MLDQTAKGKFFVRIKELPCFPSAEGQVVYIWEVNQSGIQLSMTDDCRPDSKKYQLPPTANDAGWYDVTALIMAANSLILPKYDRCVFSSDIAMNYRNAIVDNAKPIDETEAVGKLCLLGSVNGRSVNFSKQAYYIVNVDNGGYILAYSGFCQPLEEWEKPVMQQRILRLIGTSRRLFLAEPIVSACNAAYEEDSLKANKYAETIRETVSAASTDTDVGSSVFGSQLSKMRL